jgi:hypothetical protein
MINNRELEDGNDRYVIKLFDCGVLDDVTGDSNARFTFRDFTLIPGQVYQFVQP